MLKVSKIIPSIEKFKKVKSTPNNVLARTHYINFLKEEDKFFKSADRLDDNMKNYSLKVVPEFFVSLSHFAKMISQKAKSVYYFQK